MAVIERECVECKKKFVLIHHSQISCSPVCKTARVKRLKQEKYRANAEQVKAAAKAYRLANPEKIQAMRQAYKENFPERILESNKKQYYKNPEARRQYQVEHRKKHPEYLREANRRRRALQKNVVSEPYTTQQILDLYGTNCHICGEPIDLDAPRWTGFIGWEFGLHLDHLIPISRGGTDLLNNLRPAHGICNLKNTLLYFLKTNLIYTPVQRIS